MLLVVLLCGCASSAPTLAPQGAEGVQYQSSTAVLAHFEPLESWNGGEIANQYVHEGRYALRLAAGANDLRYAERPLHGNLAGDWEMSLWVHVDRPENIGRMYLAFRSGNTGNAFTLYPFTGLDAGWNHVVMSPSEFYSVPWLDRFRWADVSTVAVKLETNGNGPATVDIDDLTYGRPATSPHAPRITLDNIVELSSTRATIAWTTNTPATSRVDYGTTTRYGASVRDGGYVTTHALKLGTLAPGTRYHCRIEAVDRAGKLRRSGDFTLTTDPATPWVMPNPRSGFRTGLFEVPEVKDLLNAQRSRFTDYLSYWSSSCVEPDSQNFAYLDALAAKGQKTLMMFCSNGIMKGDTAHVRERVQKYRNHPALAGWFMFDEPEIPKVNPNALHRAYMRVHAGDPAHPAMIGSFTLDPSYKYIGSFDRILVDTYPIPFRPPGAIVKLVDNSRAVGVPFDFVYQAFSNESYRWPTGGEGPGRYPSRDEMRVMAYLALSHGAQNLYTYSYYPLHAAPASEWQWAQLNEVNDELVALGPVFASRDTPKLRLAEPSRSPLDVVLRQYAGRGYAVVVNTRAKPAPVSIGLRGPRLTGIRDVIGGRKLPADSQAIVDTLAGYDVRVYELEGQW
jgi:hypothetical protein